ncbi:MAG TPA: YitT family protein [Candidatus Limnocylindria bacterium]|nr:YitT family protein [Candidatus Limnocylindria bacterium]
MTGRRPTATRVRVGAFFRSVQFRQYLMILLGCLVTASAFPLFLEPSHIAPGGLTGLTTILNFYFGVPIGGSSLMLYIPLMVMGWRLMGRRFALRTLGATVLFSLLIDTLSLRPLSPDPMLASIFGGALLGFGTALIMRGNATTGGTDLMARIVHQKQKAITVGAFLFLFDLGVILLAWVALSAQHALHAIICVFVAAKVLDQVLIGIGTDKACYIISRKSDAIARRLMTQMDRGVTKLDATGAYSGEGFMMLLCVVGLMETVMLKQIVSEEDPQAFVFITEVHETLGEGFKKLAGEES